MTVQVKFCPFNFKNDLCEIKNQLKRLATVNVVEDMCLNYCGQCLVQPFTVINGKNIVGDGTHQLSKNITDYLATLNCKNS